MPKSFVLNDETVINDYGFRVLTGGIDTSRFEKNPVMLYAHMRPWEGKGEPALPIGRWQNIRKEGTLLLADPVFDNDEGSPDDFAKKVAHKVEKGFLRTASMYLDIVELTEDPAFMLPGQTMPTISKSVLKEGSIADIPGNENCVALTLSYQGKTIKLSGGAEDRNKLTELFQIPNKHTSMKSLIQKLNSFTGIKLADSANEAEVYAALDKVLSTTTSEIEAKKQEIIKLTSERDELKTKLEQAAAQAVKDKALALVDGAIAAKKILASEKDNYIKLAEANYDAVKAILDAKSGYEPVHAKLTTGGPDEDDDDDAALAEEWDKLHKAGKLEKLKLSSPDKYAKLFKAKYGREPKAA